MKGKINSISVFHQRGTSKRQVSRALLVPHYGVAGDAHAGYGRRQVSVITEHSLQQARKRVSPTPVSYGDFAENFVIDIGDVNLYDLLPVGSRFYLGDAILQVSEHGKKIGEKHPIMQKFGEAVVAHSGIFAVVRRGGLVSVGDEFRMDETLLRPHVAIITLSDRRSRGEGKDVSGDTIESIVKDSLNAVVRERLLIPDEKDQLYAELVRLADTELVDLILTTGGTGLGLRDTTPEATLLAADRLVPGIAELMRSKGIEVTPKASLGRAVAATRKQTLIVNLSGSPKAVSEQMEFILPILPHAMELLSGAVLNCGG